MTTATIQYTLQQLAESWAANNKAGEFSVVIVANFAGRSPNPLNDVQYVGMKAAQGTATGVAAAEILLANAVGAATSSKANIEPGVKYEAAPTKTDTTTVYVRVPMWREDVNYSLQYAFMSIPTTDLKAFDAAVAAINAKAIAKQPNILNAVSDATKSLAMLAAAAKVAGSSPDSDDEDDEDEQVGADEPDDRFLG